jgi:DNA-binding response OmpR family regulator
MANPILVVDSNLAVRKLMEFVLTREGFEASSFSDGLSALDAAFKTPPTAFVVDLRMEGMTLIQFLEKARSRENLRRIPVLLLVNTGEQYDEAKMRSLGILDTIKKPLDPIEILEKIKAYTTSDETDTIVTAVGPPPTPPPAEHIEPEDDMVRIEELLGWSSPSEESPFSEIAEIQERNNKQEEVGLESESQIKATSETAKAEDSPLDFTEVEAKQEVEDEEILQFDEEDLKASSDEKKESQFNEASFAAVSSANLSVEALPPLEEETVVASSVSQEPNLAIQDSPGNTPVQETTPPHFPKVEEMTREAVEKVVHRIAQDMVEKVAWEVIPSLAEITIKKEVGHLQVQTPQKAISGQKATSPNSSQVEEMTRQVVEEIVHKMAQDVIDKVAWEVIPSLAEITLKKEINNLKGHI